MWEGGRGFAKRGLPPQKTFALLDARALTSILLCRLGINNVAYVKNVFSSGGGAKRCGGPSLAAVRGFTHLQHIDREGVYDNNKKHASFLTCAVKSTEREMTKIKKHRIYV